MGYDSHHSATSHGLKALAAAGVGAAGVAGCTADEPSSAPGTSPDATRRLTPGTANGTAAPTTPDLSDWGVVRGTFAFDLDVAQFAAFVLAGPPGPVRDAITAARDELDTDTALALGTDFDREQLVRSKAASYLGGVAGEDIALTGSTTMGLGIVYGGSDGARVRRVRVRHAQVAVRSARHRSGMGR